MPDNLGDGEKQQVKKKNKRRKIDQSLKISNERSSIFNNAQIYSMSKEDFKGAIQEGPTYICYICWKFES